MKLFFMGLGWEGEGLPKIRNCLLESLAFYIFYVGLRKVALHASMLYSSAPMPVCCTAVLLCHTVFLCYNIK